MRTQKSRGMFWTGCLVGLFALSVIACGGGGGGGGGTPPPNTGSDTNPPNIGAIGVSPAVLYSGVSAQVTASATDAESGVASVLAVITYPDNSQASVALSLQQGQYQGAFTAQWNGVGGKVRVQIRAADRAGNQATRETELDAIGNPPNPPF